MRNLHQNYGIKLFVVKVLTWTVFWFLNHYIRVLLGMTKLQSVRPSREFRDLSPNLLSIAVSNRLEIRVLHFLNSFKTKFFALLADSKVQFAIFFVNKPIFAQKIKKYPKKIKCIFYLYLRTNSQLWPGYIIYILNIARRKNKLSNPNGRFLV